METFRVGCIGAISRLELQNPKFQREQDGKTVAIILGTVIGAVVGNRIGKSLDESDRGCIGHALELAPNQMVAGRVSQYQPARQLPLEEVRAAVRERLLGERASQMAQREGAAKLQAWRAASAGATLAAAVTVARDVPGDVPPQVVQAVMRADTTNLPAWLGVDLGAQGYAVVRVNKVVPRPAPQAQQGVQERQQVAQWWGNAEVAAYTTLLKERYKAEILASRDAKPDAAVPPAR